MDSLSQIVLGAATGEVVLGKKLGNRALALGAVAGTIPDLDIISNVWLEPMQAMDAHRGLSHSLFWVVVASFAFAGFCKWFYGKDFYKQRWYRAIIGIPLIIGVGFIASLIGYAAYSTNTIWGIVAPAVLFIGLLIPLIRYIKREQSDIEVGYWGWYFFFFWCFLTHILLDVCTTYGTQILMPFSKARFALNSVSVADPFYTVPFLIFVILVSMMRRNAPARRITNYLGLAVSIGYLFWAGLNKGTMNEVFESSLAKHGINYERYTTSPGIFNAILWSGTAESDTSYFIGAYSKMDPKPEIPAFMEFKKNHHLLAGHENDPHIEILTRFSDGYYFLEPSEDGSTIVFTDLRWGALDNVADVPPEARFPIIFHLKKNNGVYEAVEEREDPGNISRKLLESYYNRVTGKWQWGG